MGIKIGKIIATNVGHVVHTEGAVENIDIDIGHIEATGVRGNVINTVTPGQDVLRQLGLPKEVDARQVGELLQRLMNAPPADRVAEAARSPLFARMGGYALNLSTLAANLATLAGSPQAATVLKALLGGGA